ncbi:hypothetical protein JQK88_20445 [Mesorhizobium caraganae]|uniref:hypothetical protein n=1 Tax=Mesorhizobium caraganae TaxID=483206 RepID=UPI001939A645|nr:hypothetical protein [Mesorhizobium caraganae]MBM2713541.1 hypothetical protein [Mesorhizobium caraganae]
MKELQSTPKLKRCRRQLTHWAFGAKTMRPFRPSRRRRLQKGGFFEVPMLEKQQDAKSETRRLVGRAFEVSFQTKLVEDTLAPL